MDSKALITLNHIDVTFQQNQQTALHAVKDASLTINKGDIYGIIGDSGAGKSTLVRTINLLQRPTNGDVFVNQQNLTTLSAADLRQARKKIGMIFQHFNLMASRTIEENIVFSIKRSALSKKQQHEKAQQLLAYVGLLDKKDVYPRQLSGGQKQRVAIARALANNPEILISDEATSALDPKTTNTILDLLKRLNSELNLTIVLITHELSVAKKICNKLAVMQHGEILEQNETLRIFTQPQNPETATFITQASAENRVLQQLIGQQTATERLFLLTYEANTANQTLLVDLYQDYQVIPKVIYSTTEMIQGRLIAKTLISLTENYPESLIPALQQRGIQIMQQTKEA